MELLTAPGEADCAREEAGRWRSSGFEGGPAR
jgi:hypothetical protein